MNHKAFFIIRSVLEGFDELSHPQVNFFGFLDKPAMTEEYEQL